MPYVSASGSRRCRRGRRLTSSLPAECFDEIDDAWRFAEDALAEFLPRGAEPEEKFVMLDDDNEEQGYFFSCSDPDYDDHYHIVLKYSIF